MAKALIVLYDAHGWYLDIVRLAKDMLAVLDRAAMAPDRAVQEITLRTILARALMVTQGFTPEVEKAYVGAVELFERVNDIGVRQKFTVLRGLLSLYQLTGQVGQTEKIARDLMALARRDGDPRMLIDAHLTVASRRVFTDPQEGVDILDHAISLFPRVPSRPYSLRGPANDPRVSCLTTAAFGSWILGRPDRALERANQALSVAASLNHPFSTAYAHFHVGLIHTLRREFDMAHERAAYAQQIGEDHGLQIWSAVGGCLAGAAQTGLGRGDEGLAKVQSGLAAYRELRSPPVFWPILLLFSASACHRAGRREEGLRHIEATSEMVGPQSIGVLYPEFQIVKGDLLAAGLRAGGEEPAPLYQSAFDLAGSLNARMPQLRAATRLARHWQVQGETERAAQTLAPLYSRFEEGLAIADLVEARGVLSEVAPGAFPSP
jgi:hypothetical protein